MRPEPLQQDVGRNLEQDVRYEEDGEGDIRLVAFEMKVFGETKGKSIGNIDTWYHQFSRKLKRLLPRPTDQERRLQR